MIKPEIFASVLRDVCEVTGISERDIMSKSKSEEIVDARHLLVVTLRRSGYYPEMIAASLQVPHLFFDFCLQNQKINYYLCDS